MFLFATLGSALAGPCDALVDAIPTTPREELVGHYEKVVACDARAGEKAFKDFVPASGDVPTLVDLALKAIELQQFQPVWDMLEQLTESSDRKVVAQRIGGICQDKVGVLPFLQGGYFAANDRAFKMWSEAFETCDSGALTEWMEEKVVDPPARTYDDKYNSLMDALVDRKGTDALEPLQRAAVAASQRGGPFTSILEKMHEAVRPATFGTPMPPESRARLAKAYVDVGNGGVRPEAAALVADRLYQQGDKELAASLLKVVYGERVQSDGRLLYGAASVEHCGGEAVVHVASVYEPSKRWAIQPDVDGPMRTFKKRLKCDTDGPWPVVVTRSPVANEAEVESFGAEVAKEWTAKKLLVKTRAEKAVSLP